jgi:antitoxin CptB
MKNIERLRKKLRFRSWHRGTKEMDLILGRFADAHLADFDEKDLADYAKILSENDPDLYRMITGKDPIPENLRGDIMKKLCDFQPAETTD